MNIYEFDFNIVAKMDPSYVQYLEDVNKIYIKEEPTDGAGFDSDDTCRSGNRNGCAVVGEAERPFFGDDDWRLRDLEEEEREIIQALRDNAPKEVEKITPTKTHPNVETTRVECEEADALYRLKRQYWDYPAIWPVSNVLMIAPPKTILGPKSILWTNDNVCYKILESNERNKDIVQMRRSKFYHKDGKIGALSATYRFDRMRNCASEIKKYFRMMVYNTNTAKMYYINCEDKGVRKHTVRRLTQICFNLAAVSNGLNNIGSSIRIKFVQAMADHITKVITDAYIPDPPKMMEARIRHGLSVARTLRLNGSNVEIPEDSIYFARLAHALMIQHKVGKRLEWLSDTSFVNNVSEFVSTQQLSQTLLGHKLASNDKEMKASRKADSKLRRKTIQTIIPNLKKRPGAKTVTRSLFGPFYKDFFHKIMTWDHKFIAGSVSFLMDISYAYSKGILGKDMYHLIVTLSKRGDAFALKQLTRISAVLSDLRNQICVDGYVDNVDINIKMTRNMELYVRTIRNIMEQPTSIDEKEAIGWYIFRDTCDMSRTLGIRLRINKIKRANDLQQLHDRFSFFQQRDLEVRHDYARYTFLPFASPEKEYDGFRFIQLTTPDALLEEGRTMHHCVGGYSPNCLEGNSLIYSMFKGRSWITIEISGRDYSIQQKYTIKDYTVLNNKINNLIAKWHQDLLDLHKADANVYKVQALRFYEYQKAQEKIHSLMEIRSDDLSDDERSWLSRSLDKAREELEQISLHLHLGDTDHATTFEQDFAGA